MKLGFDPRAWNLLAGLTLAATACGGRKIGADTGETGDTTSGPECTSNEDCPYGYYCDANQLCQYYHQHDGHWMYECYSDQECSGPLELCMFNYCEGVGTPPPCEPGVIQPSLPLPIPEAALGLSFVDVDDDGAEELVVATSSELHTFESGSDVPIINARELDSPSITAMVSGRFHASPGEDLLILVDDELRMHPSDDTGNFISPLVSPSPVELATGLLAGSFDGVVLDDVLVWGGGGAIVEGGVDTLALSLEPILFAVARDQDTPMPGFGLRGGPGGTLLSFYGLEGGLLGEQSPRGATPLAHTTLDSGPLDITATGHVDWTLLEAWDPQTTNQQTQWGLNLLVDSMLAGDLDGDGLDELVVLGQGDVRIHRAALDAGECSEELDIDTMAATGLAIGDHDGDGDDELAVRFDVALIEVYDGEG